VVPDQDCTRIPLVAGSATLNQNRNRRPAKDFEAITASATAFLYAASVLLLIRRLARSAPHQFTVRL
jgi:hypothetical protein